MQEKVIEAITKTSIKDNILKYTIKLEEKVEGYGLKEIKGSHFNYL